MKQVLLMLSLLTLFACAAKKLAVKHADTFISNAVEKRLPLYSEQKLKLGKDIDQFLMQKKSTAEELLPVFDQIHLEKPEQFDELYEKMISAYRGIALDFSRILAKYIADLNKEQQEKFFKKLATENKEMSQKKPSERTSDMRRKIEKLTGSLSEKQEKLISEQEAYFTKKAELRLQRRLRLHEKIKAILNGKTSNDSKRDELVESFQSFQEESIDSSRENIPLIKKFISTLTIKQKETFRGKLAELKEIIGYYLETDY